MKIEAGKILRSLTRLGERSSLFLFAGIFMLGALDILCGFGSKIIQSNQPMEVVALLIWSVIALMFLIVFYLFNYIIKALSQSKYRK